jgi:hypothetical protein
MFLRTYTLLLTYFHLYSSYHCLARKHTKIGGIHQKIRFSGKCRRQEGEEAQHQMQI